MNLHHRIETVDVFPLQIPLRSEFSISRGVIGSTEKGRHIVLVRVTVTGGIIGWGEASPIPVWSPETVEAVVTAINHYLAPAVKGKKVWDVAEIHREMDRVLAPNASRGMPIAKAGIDLAVHDALGKILEIPVWALWGYTPSEQVDLSWTISSFGTIESVRAAVMEGLERGYKHFNIKVGVDLDFEKEAIKAIRQLAPRSVILADANGGIEPSRAVVYCKELQRAGADIIEQPLPCGYRRVWKEILRCVDVPIIVDEWVTRPQDVIELVGEGVCRGIALKVTRTGGLFPSRMCAEIGKNAGAVMLTSGLTDGGVALAGNLILAGCFSSEYPCPLNGPQFLADDVISGGIVVEGGVAKISRRPGLGIEVDEEKIQFYRSNTG